VHFGCRAVADQERSARITAYCASIVQPDMLKYFSILGKAVEDAIGRPGEFQGCAPGMADDTELLAAIKNEVLVGVVHDERRWKDLGGQERRNLDQCPVWSIQGSACMGRAWLSGGPPFVLAGDAARRSLIRMYE
jgi:hypothetical protein